MTGTRIYHSICIHSEPIGVELKLRKPNDSDKLTGHYFPYCQFCSHDGRCELRHNQFLGLPSQGSIDKSVYSGHEDLPFHMTVFQNGTERGTCNGHIQRTGSVYYPLGCECGTVISSLSLSGLFGGGFCQKFSPNEKGNERLRLAKQLAEERGVELSEISADDLPEPDPDYVSEMQR